jgi:hypothetical protein
MKVKALRNLLLPGGFFGVGASMDLSTEDAERLVSAGYAEIEDCFTADPVPVLDEPVVVVAETVERPKVKRRKK